MAESKGNKPIVAILIIVAVLLIIAIIYFLAIKLKSPPSREVSVTSNITTTAGEAGKKEPVDSETLWKNFISSTCTELAEVAIRDYPETILEFAISVYQDYPPHNTYLGNALSVSFGGYKSKSRSMKYEALVACINNLDIIELKNIIQVKDYKRFNGIYRKLREDGMPQDVSVFARKLAKKISRDTRTVNYGAEIIKSKYKAYYFSDSVVENEYSDVQKFYYRLGRDLAKAVQRKAEEYDKSH